MMLIVALIVYSMAMTGANLLVSHFGPWIMPINSFFLIGLDLALRDWLHFKLRAWQMGTLIVFTGVLTYLLNPSAGLIAIASSCAFTGAALSDWMVFSALRARWLIRSNASNVVGAGVDSVLFPTIAFGSLMPIVVLSQFGSKVLGGFVWSMVIRMEDSK